MNESISLLRVLPVVGDIVSDAVEVEVAPPDIDEDNVISRSDRSKVSVVLNRPTAVLKLIRERFVITGMWVARFKDASEVLMFDFDHHAELEDKLADSGVSLSLVNVRQEHAVHAGRSIMLTEFLNEVLIGVALRRMLVDAGITPHVTRTLKGYSYEGRGFVLMQRAECTLRDVLLDRLEGVQLDATAMAAMYVQILHTLAVAQSVAQFKHHDLHMHNVFIHRAPDDAEWRGQAVGRATHACYSLGSDTKFYVPLKHALWPCIADFGLSSLVLEDNTRLERADLTSFGNSNRKRWGEWTPELDGRRGYDAQVLFGDLDEDIMASRLGKHKKLKELHKRLQAACNEGQARVNKDGRPIRVSNMPPSQVLHAVFAAKPDAWYNFLTPPADAVILHVADAPLVQPPTTTTPQPTLSPPPSPPPKRAVKRMRLNKK